jgi:glycosyltransferase involved in cell wall biosynthesis
MKIAVVETDPFGGLLHYAFQLADALARRGDEVDLIASRGNELASLPSEARMLAVLTPKLQPGSAKPPGRLRALARRAAIALRLTRCWARVLMASRSGGYDAVVLNSSIQIPLLAAFAFALVEVMGKTPVAYVCHNARPFGRAEGDGHLRSGALVDRLLRAAYSRFATIFVHGEQSKRELESVASVSRVRIIPHGDERIFVAEPPPPGEEERVLFFGNWDRYKGIDVLREAFDLLSRRRAGARLTIAGSPNPQEVDVEAIRRWAAERDGVELIEGYVPLADVPAVFARARVVALPYVAGFQSGVAHLAMTMGRAVVTTDVGDIGSAVIEGETGFVVPPEDPEALAAALERVLSDEGLAERLGTEGRNRVLSGSAWETVAEKVETSLREAR